MNLHTHTSITNAFGDNAKFIDLSHKGLKGIVFMSNSSKLSRYDEIHLGEFIASGKYTDLMKKLQLEIGSESRLILKVEYSILKVCIIRKSVDSIKILSTFTIGLFYRRSIDDIFKRTESVMLESIGSQIKTSSIRVGEFFEMFKNSELDCEDSLVSSMRLFENITGEDLQKREESLISKYTHEKIWEQLA